MSMFKGKEPMPMPKEVKMPKPGDVVTIAPGQSIYAPEARETDQDAEGNFLNAHRRLKAELAEARKLSNEAVVELKARGKIIERLEADLIEAKNAQHDAQAERDQALRDCSALEQLFQNISAMTERFLMPKQIERAKDPIDLPKFEEAIEAILPKFEEVIEATKNE